MNLTQADYFGRLLTSCWNIDKLRGRTVLSAIATRLYKSERPSEDIFGDELPRMQVFGDVAVIPLCGALAIDVPAWIKELGINLTDANDVQEDVTEALAYSDVRLIAVDANTPGGQALAGEKLADIFTAANRVKPVLFYCSDGRGLASAGYQAAVSATRIYCGPYADGVGCVGSYLAYLDDTEFWTQLGMKWEMFKSGEVKGIGEGVPLSQAQREFLQSMVDESGQRFRSLVTSRRPAINARDLCGQWFDGKGALKRNFVDKLVPDLQSAIATFRHEMIRREIG